MSKMIQIRNVPYELHALLKVRAAMARMSLSDFLLAELRHVAARPSWREWADELAQLPAIDLGGRSAAEWVEEVRREREQR